MDEYKHFIFKIFYKYLTAKFENLVHIILKNYIVDCLPLR
jgi:hypothetical protein